MRQLAGTWTLVSIERPGTDGRLTALPFPRGLLVLDSAGHIFEGVQHGRPQGAPAMGERQLVLATFSGFWGTYQLDAPGDTARPVDDDHDARRRASQPADGGVRACLSPLVRTRRSSHRPPTPRS
jgi:hypothetical protein